MTIEALFAEFQKRVREDEIFLYERYNNAPLLLEFRKTYGIHLKEDDEAFFVSILKDKEWKWFVPHVLRVLETFSGNLLKELIHAAMYIHDPSFNNNFIEPCIRVYDAFPVTEILVEYLKNGSKQEKIGALQAFYWVRPHIMTLISGPDFKQEETFGYKPKWDDEHHTYDWHREKVRMTEEEFGSYRLKVDAMNHNRMQALLEAFFTNEDKDLRCRIELELPKTIQDFPHSLQETASRYFNLKNSTTIDK